MQARMPYLGVVVCRFAVRRRAEGAAPDARSLPWPGPCLPELFRRLKQRAFTLMLPCMDVAVAAA
ncbi:MAG: hypothetical protein BCS36_13545 [Desulfovibrio sp. MES5]|nr:MAG: hypothetical protein BCS36_13545 [Desulfovibrio sp. MES5]